MTIQETSARIFNPEWQPENPTVTSLPGLGLRRVEADAQGIISAYRDQLATFTADAEAEYERRQAEHRAFKASYEAHLTAAYDIDEQMRQAAVSLMDTIKLKESADNEAVRLGRELHDTELLKTAKDIDTDIFKARSTALLMDIQTSENSIAADQAWAKRPTNEDGTDEINNKIAYLSEQKPHQEKELNALNSRRALLSTQLFDSVATSGQLDLRSQQLRSQCNVLGETSAQCDSRIAELLLEIEQIKLAMDVLEQESKQKPAEVPTEPEVQRSEVNTEIIPFVQDSPRPLIFRSFELTERVTNNARAFGGFAVISKLVKEEK